MNESQKWKALSRRVSLLLGLLLAVLVTTGGGRDPCTRDICQEIRDTWGSDLAFGGDGDDFADQHFTAYFLNCEDFASLQSRGQGDDRSSSESVAGFQRPVTFEWNVGQADSAYPVLARGPGYFLFLAADGLAFDLRGAKGSSPGVLRMRIDGARRRVAIEPEEPAGKLNYFLGSDPSTWITEVPTFRRVRFRDVYPGIDVVYYNSESQLEHDFVVAPGADSRKIRLGFEGASQVKLQSDGSLHVRAGDRLLEWKKPVVYQESAGERRLIEAGYQLDGRTGAGFLIGEHDRSKPLVIDPVVSYASYLGRSSIDLGTRVAADASGNVYVLGMSNDSSFPNTPGVFTTPATGQEGDLTVTKLDATGSNRVFSTHIGGFSPEFASGIALDQSGNIYVSGFTRSRNYPTTPGALKAQFLPPGSTINDPTDCFVTKLNPSGSTLIYSTYVGGTGRDLCSGLAVDDQGSAYVTGITASSDLPVSETAPQRTNRGGIESFLAKLNPTGTAFSYSTYIGGTGADLALAVAVDSERSAFVTGSTSSTFGFPVTAGAIQSQNRGGSAATGDAFLLKMNPAGSGYTFGTYLGGSRDDTGTAVAVDSQGNANVAGVTSSANFPVTPGAAQSTYRAGTAGVAPRDAFVTKVNRTGTALVYSTYLGGGGEDSVFSIAVDAAGNAAVAGNTQSTDFPVTNDATQSRFGGTHPSPMIRAGDAILTQLNGAGTALRFSTYAGGTDSDWAFGVAVDPQGNLYMAGGTGSRDFPVTPSSVQMVSGGAPLDATGLGDLFVMKFGDGPAASGVSISAVSSAASYAGGGVAPGEILVISGSGIGPGALAVAAPSATSFPTTVAETRVLFDGVPAAMIYALGNQTSCIAPFTLAGRTSTQVVVEYRGVRSAPATLPVVAAKPGLFAANASGRGPGAILNQDFSVNSASNPAARGSVIQIFATGGGATTPASQDGQLAAVPLPRLSLPVSASIGGINVPSVAYAGAAPGLVNGLIQVNVPIPPNSPVGDVEVTITVGNARSQSGLTVAIR